MAIESISNFDTYVWIAVGLFITGLFSIMVYEKSNSPTPDKSSLKNDT
ncbi:MAG: hypothetical protein MRJ93_05800 [Nitrososphaeraceae archaeon]|nr:hypothetical protein [Nitrososphaeraceae archaeon]